VFSATVQVGGCLKGLVNYPTIQSAVNASASGGTVKVCPGTYGEAVTITHPLTVVGVSSGNSSRATIQSVFTSASVSVLGASKYVPTPSQGNHDTVYPQILVQNTGAVNISNLTFDATTLTQFDTVAIYYQNSSGTVNHVTDKFEMASVWVENDDGNPETVTVTNSSLFGAYSVVAFSHLSNLTVNASGNRLGSGFYSFGTSGKVTANWFYTYSVPVILDSGSTISLSQNEIAYGNPGGVILASSGNSISYNKVEIYPGSIGVYESGVYVDDGGVSNTINNNTFLGNTANSGPANTLGIDFGCRTLSGNVVKSNVFMNTSVGIANIPTGNSIGPNSYFDTDVLTSSCF
jgi:hypothetical protein